MANLLPPADRLPSPRLDDRARAYVQESKAKNTTRAYRSAFTDFTEYCRSRGLRMLPAEPQTVLDYVVWLADGAQKVSTIQVKLSAIGFAHRANELNDPTQHPSVQIVMQGIRRKHGTAPTQKQPITRALLEQLVRALPGDLRGQRNKAMFLLAYAGAFRRSELCALDVSDVQISADEMTVRVKRSKTDPEGRSLKKRIPRLQDRRQLCPVRAVEEWLHAAELRRGPLFRAIDRWGHVRKERMSDRDLALFVKQAARRAGLDAARLAGHSFRAGFVTQAASDGVPEWEIQRVTTHKSSDVLRRYIRDEGLGQGRAIRRALGDTADKEG